MHRVISCTEPSSWLDRAYGPLCTLLTSVVGRSRCISNKFHPLCSVSWCAHICFKTHLLQDTYSPRTADVCDDTSDLKAKEHRQKSFEQAIPMRECSRFFKIIEIADFWPICRRHQRLDRFRGANGFSGPFLPLALPPPSLRPSPPTRPGRRRPWDDDHILSSKLHTGREKVAHESH